MAGHHYRFLTRWRMEGTAEEVYKIINDTNSYPQWWPSVWLKVETLDPGDSNSIGKRVRLTTKGWLPYILKWEATVLDKTYGHRIHLRADGDFKGEGIWTFQQEGAFVNIEYKWEIVADKPLLKYLSFLLKPLFSMNHNWAMAKGEDSLRLELARRRSQTPEERAKVPAPPQPVFLSRAQRSQLGMNRPI